jgi:hypothetical protein
MSIFSTILAKIFPGSHPAIAAANTTPAAPGDAPVPQAVVPPATAFPPVDVEKILEDRSSANAEKLNWRTSIVDLMKLLALDSSLGARKTLAAELHYAGDMNDSAGMNIWLHKQVMSKLAANGGKVPADLH